MDLTWPIRIRIALAAAIGVVLIGLLCWPMVAQNGSTAGLAAVAKLSFSERIYISLLAIFCGFAGALVSMPYAKQIGVLAVPAGLLWFSIKTIPLSRVIQQNPAANARIETYNGIAFESFIWLALILLGCLGAIAAAELKPKKQTPDKDSDTDTDTSKGFLKITTPTLINGILATAVSAVIGAFFVMVFAQDVSIPDVKFGSVMCEPSRGQILFACFTAFGIAAFATKLFLNANYIWTIISTAIVSTAAILIFAKGPNLDYMQANWPANFTNNSLLLILPVQMVAAGAIGAINGYWTAKRYQFWRENESA